MLTNTKSIKNYLPALPHGHIGTVRVKLTPQKYITGHMHKYFKNLNKNDSFLCIPTTETLQRVSPVKNVGHKKKAKKPNRPTHHTHVTVPLRHKDDEVACDVYLYIMFQVLPELQITDTQIPDVDPLRNCYGNDASGHVFIK